MKNMPLNELVKRYTLFFTSVLIQGFAIATITFANIGTTPISSPNYVISLHTPLTLGDTTMIFNVILITLQLIILRSKIKDHVLDLIMQIPVIFLFSWMIDFGMTCLNKVLPDILPYYMSWVLIVTGTVLLSISISLSVVASVCMVPGEYFLKVFHPIVNKSFSFVKTFFDNFLVLTAVILSLILTNFSAIEGVREGTLFSALFTGPLVHLFIPKFMYLTKFLSAKDK